MSPSLPLSTFVDLPKADLHLHVLGAIRPDTVAELARSAGSDVLATAERAIEEGYAFSDLGAFVSFFLGLFPLVLDEATFERVTFEALEDAAAAGVRFAEVRFTPTSHLSRGADEGAMFAGIAAGRRAAEEAHGIASRVVLDFPRTLGVDVAEAALAVALRNRAQGVVGFDIAGDESACAVEPAYARVFARARREGLGVTAHAGEAAGPASVRAALDLYGVRRIGHGTRAAEDPALVRRLAEEQIVLEVCPSSNLALGVVSDLALHPLSAFLDAGVPCVLATDDPALFRTDAAREFERMHREAGVPADRLGEVAARSFETAFVEAGASGDALRSQLAAWASEARANMTSAADPDRDDGAFERGGDPGRGAESDA